MQTLVAAAAATSRISNSQERPPRHPGKKAPEREAALKPPRWSAEDASQMIRLMGHLHATKSMDEATHLTIEFMQGRWHLKPQLRRGTTVLVKCPTMHATASSVPIRITQTAMPHFTKSVGEVEVAWVMDRASGVRHTDLPHAYDLAIARAKEMAALRTFLEYMHYHHLHKMYERLAKKGEAPYNCAEALRVRSVQCRPLMLDIAREFFRSKQPTTTDDDVRDLIWNVDCFLQQCAPSESTPTEQPFEVNAQTLLPRLKTALFTWTKDPTGMCYFIGQP